MEQKIKTLSELETLVRNAVAKCSNVCVYMVGDGVRVDSGMDIIPQTVFEALIKSDVLNRCSWFVGNSAFTGKLSIKMYL